MKKHVMSLVLAVGLMGATALPSMAQVAGGDAGGAGGNVAGGQRGGGQGGGRNRGNWDPAARLEQMQKDMGATDDEWKVLKPKIEAVQKLQREGMMARFAGMGGNRRRGGDNNNGGDQAAPAVSANAAAVTKATTDLRAALDNKDSTPEQIKAALQALRDAKTKVKEEISKAQDDLKSVASVRQEAVLVRDGILE